MMHNYKVRPRDLMDLVDLLKSGSLITSPYFQRNLVWRENHKVDFIKTILLNFPFPEIFISRGHLDLENQKSISCVVDGQQRLNTILEFLNGDISVDGKYFNDLHANEKQDFLKYEIAVIDLDLDQNDPKITEIFQRLNRTFYALNTIEKLSTEYASSDFMLIAKLLCGELRKNMINENENHKPDKNIDPRLYKTDPNITEEFTDWGNSIKINSYQEFIIDSPIFTKYEISRQTHLLYTLNILATILFGFYSRNEQVNKYLDHYSENFPDRDVILTRLNDVAEYFMKFKFAKGSPWYSKSNAFSLYIAIYNNFESIKKTNIKTLKSKLSNFIDNVDETYMLAARESVNGKAQRLTRHNYIKDIIQS
jgi:Protein of unknown function DUF262